MTASSTKRDFCNLEPALPASTTPVPILRRTLPGEYVSLILISHAVLGSLTWSISSFTDPSNLFLVAIGLWVVLRASGLFAGRAFTPWVTTGLILIAWRWQPDAAPTASYLWFFSPPVTALMLNIVLFFDIADFLVSPKGIRMRNRLRAWNWHRIAIWAFAAAFLIYMVLVPTAYYLIESQMPTESRAAVSGEMTLGEIIRLRSMEAMTGLMFFTLGATIGSFLNVVVFRMPRGESVVFRASRCPQCETPINGRDNVPILGWLLLNGRCRACQASISFRYPAVETVCAVMFLLLYFVELISGGDNLPIRRPNFYDGVVFIIFYTKWDLVALYFFHCFTLCMLLTWALVDVDRQRVPWWARLSVFGMLLAALAMMPDLLPVPWRPAREFAADGSWSSALLNGVVGGAYGLLLGTLVWSFRRKPDTGNRSDFGTVANPPMGHVISASVIVGISVGWQAAIGVWLISLVVWPVVCWIANRMQLRQPPLTLVLLAAFLVHLCFWRSLNVRWWPSYETTQSFWISWSIVFVALCVATRFLARTVGESPADDQAPAQAGIEAARP